MSFVVQRCWRYLTKENLTPFFITRNKSQRAKQPHVPKEKETKYNSKTKIRQIVVTDTPEFWGLGLTEPPVDDVWNRRLHKIPYYSLAEALMMHREFASPEMTDNMEGFVVLEAQLDMTTKKKTKFMGLINGVVLLPHNYDNMIQGRVLTIAKTDEDQKIAAEAGAVFSGGLDLIRKIERGDISADEYDYVVLHPDLLLEASILKRVLQDRFPSKKRGNLGINIFEMVNLFTNGRQFESSKISESIAKIVMPFGKLSMQDETLYVNLKSAIETFNSFKPNGKLVKQIGVLCPPSKEIFLIKDDQILAQQVAVITKEDEDDDDEKDKTDETVAVAN